jgi:hypothetical protein
VILDNQRASFSLSILARPRSVRAFVLSSQVISTFIVSSGKSSKTALAVVKLQHALPSAKVVYCSATGASEPANLGKKILASACGLPNTYGRYLIISLIYEGALHSGFDCGNT